MVSLIQAQFPHLDYFSATELWHKISATLRTDEGRQPQDQLHRCAIRARPLLGRLRRVPMIRKGSVRAACDLLCVSRQRLGLVADEVPFFVVRIASIGLSNVGLKHMPFLTSEAESRCRMEAIAACEISGRCFALPSVVAAKTAWFSITISAQPNIEAHIHFHDFGI